MIVMKLIMRYSWNSATNHKMGQCRVLLSQGRHLRHLEFDIFIFGCRLAVSRFFRHCFVISDYSLHPTYCTEIASLGSAHRVFCHGNDKSIKCQTTDKIVHGKCYSLWLCAKTSTCLNTKLKTSKVYQFIQSLLMISSFHFSCPSRVQDPNSGVKISKALVGSEFVSLYRSSSFI